MICSFFSLVHKSVNDYIMRIRKKSRIDEIIKLKCLLCLSGIMKVKYKKCKICTDYSHFQPILQSLLGEMEIGLL